MPSPRYFTLPVVLAGLVLIGNASAEAQTIRLIGPQRVTVKAEGIALGELLDQLSAVSPLESLKIDPAVRSLPVSLMAEDVSALDAMWLVLRASGVDFVMSSRRVLAGRAEKAVESPGASREGPEVWPNEKREAAQEPPTAEPRPPAIDEHDLVQAVVPVLAPASPAIMDRPELAVGSTAPSAAEGLINKRQPIATMSSTPSGDEFGRDVGARVVPFTIHEDSVTITQAGFVPFKLRPDVKARRLSINIGDIP